MRKTIASVIVFLLATAVMLSGCGKKNDDWATQGGESGVVPPVVEQQQAEIVYEVLGSAVVNGRLEVNVSAPNMGSIQSIAERVVLNYPEAKSAMSVLFYQPGQVPGKDVPAHRIDWTKAKGYKQVF